MRDEIDSEIKIAIPSAIKAFAAFASQQQFLTISYAFRNTRFKGVRHTFDLALPRLALLLHSEIKLNRATSMSIFQRYVGREFIILACCGSALSLLLVT